MKKLNNSKLTETRMRALAYVDALLSAYQIAYLYLKHVKRKTVYNSNCFSKLRGLWETVAIPKDILDRQTDQQTWL